VTATPGLTFTPYEKLKEEGATYGAFSNPVVAKGVAAWTVEYQVGKTNAARLRGILDGEGELVQATTWSGWYPAQVPVFLARRQADSVACVQVLEPGPPYPVTDLRTLPLTADGKPVPPSQGMAVSLTTANGSFLLIDCDLPGVKRAGSVETADTLWVGKAKP
jgi:hypothetical protein